MKIGIVGAGAIAAKAHIPALLRMENVELEAIADVDLPKAKALAKKFHIAKAFDRHIDLLRENLDAVVICVPSPLHAKITLDALLEGKHVLVEKPLAMTVSEAIPVINLAKDRGLKVGVVHNYRYFPAVKKTINKIREGRLGHVTSIVGIAHTVPPMSWTQTTWLYSQGGVIDDFAPHLFDLTALIADSDPRRVTAVGKDMAGYMGCVNQAQILIEFENGISALCDAAWMVGTRRVFSTVYGTGGELLLDIISNFVQEVHGDATPLDDMRLLVGRTLTLAQLAFSKRLFFGALYFHRAVILDFIQSVQRNASPPPGLNDALRVVQISEAARMSVAENRSVIVSDLSSEVRDE